MKAVISSVMTMPRDYKKEYASYHAKPEQKKARARRNKSRREAEKAGKVRKGDGKHVHHPGSMARSKKTVVTSAKKNLSNTRCGPACRKAKAAGGRKSKPR